MQASPEFQPLEGPQRHPVRVLLLEDDRISAEIFGAYLRRIPGAAAELSTAGTLAEALALLERGGFNLVVSDLNLPDSSGAATVAALAGAAGLIIAISSDDDPALRQTVLASGAYEFLHKSELNEAALQRLVRLAVMQSRVMGSLQESEARFRQTFELAASGIAHLGLDGRYLRVNKSLCRILGYAEDELIGRVASDLSHPEDRGALRRQRQRMDSGELHSARVQKRYLRKDGSAVWVDAAIALVRDAQGRPMYEIAVFEDISHAKQAETALRWSEARYRTLTELSSDWYWEQDAELRFVATAGSSDARGGITPESHIGAQRWELPDTEIVGQSWQEHKAVLAARLPFYDLLLRRTPPNGPVRYVSVSGRPLFDAQGGFAGYCGVAKDVTTRVLSEQALKESEARFRSLSELSADVFWEQDTDYRFTAFSEQSPRRSLRAHLGKRRSQLGYINMSAADWAGHYALLDARRTFHDLELCRMEDGQANWITVSGAPFFAADGSFRGYRGVGRNITARKRDEALLRLEHTVTRCLAEAESAEAALSAVLRAVCEAENWECGRYFVADEAAGALRFSQAWGLQTRAVEEFIARSRQTTYRRGEGLSGTVWASGEPLWLSDVSKDPRASGLSRAAVDAGGGLSGGSFVLPVIAEGRTVGVLSFSRAGTREPDARLVQAMRVIGSQIGVFVQRQAALVAVRESQAKHLRYQDKIARFGQSALAGGDASALEKEAVQNVLEGLRADAVAYLEPGADGAMEVRALVGAQGSDWDRAMASKSCVPVRTEGRQRGLLCAVSRAEGAYAAEDLNFLDAAASVLSTGLQRIESESRLAFLAQFDPLTGLPNRALLADRFAQMIVQARRRGSQLGVLFVDLDEFKLVNDTLGHAAGDELLREAAARLQAAVRDGDTVARISGDEFAVVLADLSRQEDAALVAQKIIDRLAASFELGNKETFVTASVGIAAFPGDGEDAETLLGAADAAMYRAKQSGRNTFQFFTAEINQRTRARAQLGAELRHALEREEFTLAYQPKYDLATRQPCGAEALLRWNHPERGAVPPAEFVPVLEETGLIVAVGEWVLERACRDLKAWAAAGIAALPVAVNLSARQFRQSGLDQRIAAVLSAARVSPGLIELEITESQLMHDPDQAIRTMQSLRDQGIRIAIDDFGTGYSSLAYLTRFPVAALKVDRSFVAGIQRQDTDAAIVRTIIEMARTLGFTVIAEGVEQAAQVEFLRQFGCHQAQGYLFARPMPADELRALIYA